jgi:WD40 repeat protein
MDRPVPAAPDPRAASASASGGTSSASAGPDRTQTIQSPRRDASRDRDPATAPTVARGTPSWNEATATLPSALPIDAPDRYSLVGEHARGGLGRVVRAVDTRLGRTVAVKELLKKSDTAEALFVREALITARLQHPGIVPVIEAGRWPSGEPYYVMKLVEGRSLKELIADRKTLPQRLALLPHVIAVADAIGYAHSRDVIHRDLKPANVVVGEFGETVVVDWGLARDGRAANAAADDERLTTGLIPSSGSAQTVSGRVIGTPQYMSPEQARGEVVDARSDVYSLGALLYEVLAGAPPYTGPDADAILERVCAGPPPPLAAAQPDVPTDLLAIVTKAMDRAPAQRYPTAKELAQDLQRFATGQLVSAQRYSTLHLVRRWVRKNRGVVAALVASGVILVLVAVGMIGRIVEERNVARREGKRAQVARTLAEAQTNNLRALQAESSVRRDPTATVAWLKQYPLDADSADEVATLLDEALASGVARHVMRQDDWVYDVAFTPDGRTLATGSKDGKIRVYDTGSGAVRVLGEHPGGIMAVRFVEDGKALITGGNDGDVRLWPTAGGAARAIGQLDGPIATLDVDAAGVLRARSENEDIGAWQLPQGTQVMRVHDHVALTNVTAGAVSPVAVHDWTVAYPDGRVVRLDHGEPTAQAWTLPRAARQLAYAHDGRRVAIYDGTDVHVADLATGAIRVIGSVSAPVRLLAWSHDDAQLALCGEMHDAFLFATAPAGAPAAPRVLGHADAIYNVEFTRDGRRVLTASDDGTAKVWDLVTGHVEVLRGHDDDVYQARFSPDETMVATASLDGTARLWPLGGSGGRVLGGDVGAIYGVHLLPGGDAITVSMPFQIHRWDLASGTATAIVPRTDSVFKTMRPAISDAGDVAYTPEQSGDIHVVRRDGSTVVLRGHAGRVSGGGFAADGALITAGYDGTVRRWDVARGTGEVISRGAPVIEASVPSTRDQLLVARDREIALLDFTGRVIARVPMADVGWAFGATKATFSPDGKRVLFLRKSSTHLWTPATGAVTPIEWTGHHATNVAFSPDGATLAGAMADRTVRLWRSNDGRLLRTFTGHTDLVMSAAFSPDGALLATVAYDRTVRVWNVTEGTSRVLRGHAASVEAVRWIEDGRTLLTASRDGTLRLWPVPTTSTADAAELRRRIEAATTAVVGPDDRLATPVAP